MNYKEVLDSKVKNIEINNYLQQIDIDEIRKDIFSGLCSKKKHISSKYFYDKIGSELFEEITNLPEYYPTRTERGILRTLDIRFFRDFKNLDIWELGSGDYSKISLIIGQIPNEYRDKLTYKPIDISKSAIEVASEKLLEIYPNIVIKGFVADFTKSLDFMEETNNRLLCFLGSTIGNFTSEQRDDFLGKINQIMNKKDYFLLGIDTIKNRNILDAAYNDSQGVTAKFNLNILNVVNGLCKTNFNTEDFRHIAFYNEFKKRIEMYLEARRDIIVESNLLEEDICIKKGERIHTENSHKFNDDMIFEMTEKSGFDILKVYRDERNLFNLILLRKR